jgi:hypothetical protein
MTPNVRTDKVILKQLRSFAADTLVEVPHDYPRARQFAAVQDAFVKQPVALVSALKISRYEVDVEDMKQQGTELNVSPKTPARFAAGGADVVVSGDRKRKARKNNITVAAALHPARFTEGEIQFQSVGDDAGLIKGPVPSMRDNFLQRYHIRIHLPEDLDNPRRTYTLIHAPAFVDVVGHNSQCFQ